ncbi:MAG: hypothetical protein IJ459_06950 [Clostridia bacterium]|nr:hypothetical protein [Clostridia bacterium]
MKIFKKVTMSLLAIILLAITLLGITAAAEGESAEGSEGPVPRIVSKNLSYSSYLHIFYAIPVGSVPEGSTLEVDFYESDPDGGAACAYTVTDAEIENIKVISGKSEPYYVVSSRGFAPKNATRRVWAVPVATSADGTRTEGEAVPYSVAEYCFERLTVDEYMNVADDGSLDSLRRELYVSLLSYINCSQDALGVSGDKTPTLSTLAYLGVKDGSFDGISHGFVNTDTSYTVTELGEKPEGYTFRGWNISTLDISGSTSRSVSSASSFSAKLSGGEVMLVAANYDKTPEVARAEEIAKQEKLDEEERDRQWAALEEAFVSSKGYTEENAEDLTDALKTLYTLYGKDMVTWVASLYAKGYNDIEGGRWAGGFYASTAGRDAAGFGPDLQCTVQLLRFLQQSGVIDSVSEDIPEWMAHELVYFAKSLQDPNGYYYHPQWGKEFTDTKISRRGRDLGWGNSLLEFFGEDPVYDTPNGLTGDGESADDYLRNHGLSKPSLVSNGALSMSISESGAVAVSKVIFASDSTDKSTAYLKSHTAFIDYLLTTIAPGMRISCYNTGNTLNATSGQIGNFSNKLGVYTYKEGDEASTAGAAADDYRQFDGMTMKEMVLKVLDDAINPNTGLFGGYNEETKEFLGMESINFSNTNGFFKVIGLYNSWGHAYPKAALAAVGLISNLTNPDLPSTGNACDVYNVWNAIGSLRSNSSSKDTVWAIEALGNLQMCTEDTEGARSMTVAQFINKTLELRGADAVRITYDKIKGYKKVDGGFAHSYYHGGTNHQGCPVSPSGNNVSDVDATCISSTGLTRSIFTAFGMDKYKPDFFGKADYMRFIDCLEEAEPVYKSTVADITDTFDTDKRQNGISGEYEISDGYLTVLGDTEILRSPYATRGVATVLDMKVLFALGEHTLTFTAEDGVIAIFDAHSAEDTLKLTNRLTGSYVNVQTDGGYVDLSFEFRLEGDTLTLWIIRNSTVLYEESLTSTDSTVVPERLTGIGAVRLTTGSQISFDSLAFGTTTPSYKLKDAEDRINFENLGVGDYDYSKYTSFITFSNATSGENASRALIVAEGENKFLRLEDNWGNGSVTAQNYFEFKRELKECETVVFEARMRIEANIAGVIPITVLNSSSDAAYYGAMKISDGYLYANVANSKNTRTTNMVKTSVKEGEWFFVRLEYTAGDEYDESFICKIYINGTLMDSESEEQSGLTYSSSSNIGRFRMACDTNWTGTLDYDMIYVGGLDGYTPPTLTDSPSSTHVHIPAPEVVENLTDYTCSLAGKYESVTYCEDSECGAEISRIYVSTPASHRPGDTVIENVKDNSCIRDGSYDEVSYCTECGEECRRVTVSVPASHTEGETVEENRTEPTCTISGSLDRVTYCTECGEELKRITVILAPTHTPGDPYDVQVSESTCTEGGVYYRVVDCTACGEELGREERHSPLKPHNIVAGVCTECGGTDFVMNGVIDFEDVEAAVLISADKSGYVNSGSESSINTKVYFKVPSKGVATAEIVSEGDNKYVVLDKITNTTSTNTWVDIFRDTGRDADLIYFESKINVSFAQTGGGLYVRLYTGRSTSSDGTRITYHTVSQSGGCLTYAGNKTHLKVGEWGTVRITLEKSGDGYLYTFLVKNETAGAITKDGVSYFVGEFVPYFTTSSLIDGVTLDSLSEVSCITFMQSTASLSTVKLDEVYFGESPSLVTRN